MAPADNANPAANTPNQEKQALKANVKPSAMDTTDDMDANPAADNNDANANAANNNTATNNNANDNAANKQCQ